MAAGKALLLAAWVGAVQAQNNYTVHASVIFANTGERTPMLDQSSAQSLTNLGARQMYNLGAFFRQRYVSTGVAGNSLLQGISSPVLDNDQIFIQTLNNEYTVSSAVAFMQALYPPFTQSGTTDTGSISEGALTNNNTYIEAPLNGYQYPTIGTVSRFDPYSVFLSGTTNCPNFQSSASEYYSSVQFNVTELNTRDLYQRLGEAVLNGVMPRSQWDFSNAYMIFDYIHYLYTHNATIYEYLSSPESALNVEQLHSLASEKQWQIYGDQNPSAVSTGDKIRTVAGQTLAARIVGMLTTNIKTYGANAKFILTVGEYDTMLSLFSLLGLDTINRNFRYIPPFGSAFAIELFSYTNSSTAEASYPAVSDLWIRFLYLNGSLTSENASPSIQAYPILGRGPSQTDLKFTSFASDMLALGIENIGDWCSLCNSQSIFCPAFEDPTYTGGPTFGRERRTGVSPPVAGVIGAVIALAAAGLLFALLALCAGLRLRREPGKARAFPRRKVMHDLGGFKGTGKLASDADLHLPKNGAPVGFAEGEPAGDKKVAMVVGSHERMGSWELGEGKGMRDTFGSFGGETVTDPGEFGKRSFEEGEAEPFETPVRPRESV